MPIPVTCDSKKHDDGYSWKYGGSKDRGELVACPSCGYKVRLPDE